MHLDVSKSFFIKFILVIFLVFWKSSFIRTYIQGYVEIRLQIIFLRESTEKLVFLVKGFSQEVNKANPFCSATAVQTETKNDNLYGKDFQILKQRKTRKSFVENKASVEKKGMNVKCEGG